jgi:hypothetical protein
MNTQLTLTDLEKQVLEGINNSDYGDQLGDVIWSGTENCAISGTKTIAGVYSSLSKKGLVGTDGKGSDAQVWLTELGVAVCKEQNLLGKFK